MLSKVLCLFVLKLMLHIHVIAYHSLDSCLQYVMLVLLLLRTEDVWNVWIMVNHGWLRRICAYIKLLMQKAHFLHCSQLNCFKQSLKINPIAARKWINKCCSLWQVFFTQPFLRPSLWVCPSWKWENWFIKWHNIKSSIQPLQTCDWRTLLEILYQLQTTVCKYLFSATKRGA